MLGRLRPLAAGLKKLLTRRRAQEAAVRAVTPAPGPALDSERRLSFMLESVPVNM